MGGKSRVAKQLSEVMLSASTNRVRYVEPFVGGGAVASKMGNHFKEALYGDAHQDLMLMWQAVLETDWLPPLLVTEAEYKELRHAEPSALRGFVGMGGSFGGKWFGGYAKGGFTSKGEPRNHQAESARAVLKVSEGMRAQAETRAVWGSYTDITPYGNEVIYCDPPYADSTGYSTGDFDSGRFWDTIREWSELGAQVFVSEYSAPDDFECLWSKDLIVQVKRGDSQRHSNTEKLFRWKGNS
jgi:DNA adenine methylase